MKRLYSLLVAILMVAAAGAACGGAAPAEEAEPEMPAYNYQPHASLAQVMRGIPFPNSNIIFDAQSNDPGAPPEAATGSGGGALSTYSNVYGGWEAVELAGKALEETVNLVMIPGRSCENGLPVPLEDETFKNAAQGLIDAGEQAYNAAVAKDFDAFLDVSGVMADACANCHNVYRDVPEGEMRCVPEAEITWNTNN